MRCTHAKSLPSVFRSTSLLILLSRAAPHAVDYARAASDQWLASAMCNDSRRALLAALSLSLSGGCATIARRGGGVGGCIIVATCHSPLAPSPSRLTCFFIALVVACAGRADTFSHRHAHASAPACVRVQRAAHRALGWSEAHLGERTCHAPRQRLLDRCAGVRRCINELLVLVLLLRQLRFNISVGLSFHIFLQDQPRIAKTRKYSGLPLRNATLFFFCGVRV